MFLLNYASEILYGGSPCISLEPRAPPFGRGAIGALAAYFLPNFRQIGQEMGFKLLSLFLLNYESYSVKNLYEGSPCILFGCGTISDTLAAYYLLNLSQIGRDLVTRRNTNWLKHIFKVNIVENLFSIPLACILKVGKTTFAKLNSPLFEQ